MPIRLRTLAIAAALTAGASSMAMAQYACPPGYAPYGGACQPVAGPGPYAPGAYAPGNPVSGAVAGERAGAAQGAATAGPVGAIVGGAIGTATGTIAGTANAVAGAPVMPAYGSTVPAAPACGPGYTYYSGGCYPAH